VEEPATGCQITILFTIPDTNSKSGKNDAITSRENKQKTSRRMSGG